MNKNKKVVLTLAIFITSGLFGLTIKVAEKSPKKTVEAKEQTEAVLGASVEQPRGAVGEFDHIPKKIIAGPLNVFDISTKAFLVIDEPTQTVLLEKNSYEKLPIASLTKLMTALLAYEKLKPDEYLEISREDMLSISPTLGFEVGEKLKISDLMESVLVCSANDAARALANAVAKQTDKSFIALMNETAVNLELIGTRFSNPNGFDSENNYSTARDLVKLAGYTQNFAAFKNLGKKTKVELTVENGKIFSCKATNKLVGKNLEIEAIKTGYTPWAKGSIIARVTQNGSSLIVVVIGSEDRESDLLRLSKIVFSGFSWE